MKDFEKVWPRVSGKNPPPPPPPKPEPFGPPPPPPPEREDVRELAELIRRETAAERQFRALAGQTRGNAAQTLRQLAMQSRGLVRKLQADYYLRTGDTCPVPPGEKTRFRNFQEGLRDAWEDARGMERAYLDAAGRTKDNGLASLYGDAAELKQRQQRELRGLIQRMMG